MLRVITFAFSADVTLALPLLMMFSFSATPLDAPFSYATKGVFDILPPMRVDAYARCRAAPCLMPRDATHAYASAY